MTINEQAKHDDPPRRSLTVLRAAIDALDHDVLQLLARRSAVVAELAQWKRQHRAPIRDFARERELIADRRERATQLGLSPEAIESLYRLILWSSRDQQASLRAEVPPEMQPRTVAVIGGKGRMGACMAKLFADLGHVVMVADLDTTLRPEQAVRQADVVIVSVPIEDTCEVIRAIGPLMRPEGLLMDVASVKSEPVSAMLESTQASVVGSHPLFAPSVHSLQGQRVVLCRGRGDAWFEWVRDMFGARGLNTVEATTSAHDRAMAIVQVLVHFSTEVMGRTLLDLDVPIQETLRFTSPIYLMELLMTARHFAQEPQLYASIQMSNPDTDEVTQAFVRSAQSWREVVLSGDREAFSASFDELRRFLGSFTDQALEQSSFLIDRLVERA